MRRVTALAVCAAVAVAVMTSAAGRSLRRADVRGLWVVRTSLTTPQSIQKMVAAAKQAGINTLLVQVRGRGEAFYRSDIEPRSADLATQSKQFDPLATTIEHAHRAGLQVHAWVNINLVASATYVPRSRNHIVLRHPEWLMLPNQLVKPTARMDPRSASYLAALRAWTRAESKSVEGLYLSPVPNGSQTYTTNVVRELVRRYPLDGLHFDYIRYPNLDFDYSRAALSEFRDAHAPAVAPRDRERFDRAARTDPAIWAQTYPSAWTSFRRDRLTSLVDRLRTVARSTRPGIVISVAAVPDASEARERRLQDWIEWARRGYVDAVCPMAYTTNPNEFSALIAAAREELDRTPLWAGIGADRLPVAGAAQHIRIARKLGAAGVVLFSYDELVSRTAGGTTSLAALGRTLREVE